MREHLFEVECDGIRTEEHWAFYCTSWQHYGAIVNWGLVRPRRFKAGSHSAFRPNYETDLVQHSWQWFCRSWRQVRGFDVMTQGMGRTDTWRLRSGSKREYIWERSKLGSECVVGYMTASEGSWCGKIESRRFPTGFIMFLLLLFFPKSHRSWMQFSTRNRQITLGSRIRYKCTVIGAIIASSF